MMSSPQLVSHQWLGWRAPALRRLILAAAAGLVVALALALFVAWQVAVLSGWDAAALTFLLGVGPMIFRADGPHTELSAMHEDPTRDTARLLLVDASAASLLAVGFVLGVASRASGGERVALITLATLTVVLSWTLVNTMFALHYAHLYYSLSLDSIDFGGTALTGRPDYGDFAYLAFTIGMTYQVSDTALRGRQMRRSVLHQAVLSYLFGVVIVATGVSIIAGLLG